VRARKAPDETELEEEAEEGLLERVRAFSAGVAVGSKNFVEQVFRERRELFGPKRESGARPLDGGGGMLPGALRALRDLRRR
jgi:hypothetical protein